MGALHHAWAEPGALQLPFLSRPRLQAQPGWKGARLSRQVGQATQAIRGIHEIACPSENELYVAEILTWRVQKLILRPDQQKAAAEGAAISDQSASTTGSWPLTSDRHPLSA